MSIHHSLYTARYMAIVGENSILYVTVGDVTKVKDAKIVVYTCDFDAMGTETKVSHDGDDDCCVLVRCAVGNCVDQVC